MLKANVQFRSAVMIMVCSALLPGPLGAVHPETLSAIERYPRNAAEFDQLFNQIKQWGRWAPDDQLGAANWITEAKRQQAFALAKVGRIVSLSHTLLTEKAVDNETPFERTMIDWGFTTEAAVGFSGDVYKTTYHGSAHSHFDALCHVAYKGKTFNGYPVKEVYSDKGCTKLGVEHLKNGIVTRGILLDIPRLKKLPYLEPGTPVFVEDIEAWEKQAGVRVAAGDAIFLRTGRWARRAIVGPWPIYQSAAGFHASVAPWLKARGVSFIGSDFGSEVFPSSIEGVHQPLHALAIAALGIGIFDNQDLEAVAQTAAELNRWEFLLSVAPMPVTGGTGSPTNALAIF